MIGFMIGGLALICLICLVIAIYGATYIPVRRGDFIAKIKVGELTSFQFELSNEILSAEILIRDTGPTLFRVNGIERNISNHSYHLAEVSDNRGGRVDFFLSCTNRLFMRRSSNTDIGFIRH